MILTLNYTEFYNDVCESIRAFYPDVDIVLGDDGDIAVTAKIHDGAVRSEAQSRVGEDVKVQSASLNVDVSDFLIQKRMLKRVIKLSVYKLMVDITGQNHPWGSLTGIRPTKMIYDGGLSYQELNEVYGVSKAKCALLDSIIKNQKAYIDSPEDSFDIYIGIPFCKTRCVYCSFATNDATKSKLIPQYIDTLIKEIREVSNYLLSNKKRPRCVYIGGGTPTALDEYNLERLLNECLIFDPSIEFTVEAGRPDTINKHKLQIIKNAGVDRISINPQTMHDSTLGLNGRKHSSDEIIKCFDLARSVVFNNINMDVIAGLPGENVAMLCDTLERILVLAPENVTVHTLSIKRGSYIAENPHKFPMPSQETAEAMVEKARSMLVDDGYEPYYIYRQKYQNGNLENVGYCKPEKQCVYNIDIMEETTSIIA